MDKCTSDNPTGQPGDALDLRHVVLDEVFVTLRAAHVPRGAELPPQLAGLRVVPHHHCLGTHVKETVHQRPVAQHADPEGEDRVRSI